MKLILVDFLKRQIFELHHTEYTTCKVRWSTGLVSPHPPGMDCAKAPDTANTQQTRLNKPMVFSEYDSILAMFST